MGVSRAWKGGHESVRQTGKAGFSAVAEAPGQHGRGKKLSTGGPGEEVLWPPLWWLWTLSAPVMGRLHGSSITPRGARDSVVFSVQGTQKPASETDMADGQDSARGHGHISSSGQKDLVSSVKWPRTPRAGQPFARNPIFHLVNLSIG